MKRQRVLVLMHEDLVPPEQLAGCDPKTAEWRTEYDVVTTLKWAMTSGRSASKTT